MRSLLFAIWIKAGKDAASTLALVEALVANEYETISKGGARIVSANVAGKQFTYELPPGWAGTDFIENLRFLYKHLTTGGASGGVMTDTEVSNYAIDSTDQVTSISKARFSFNPGRRL